VNEAIMPAASRDLAATLIALAVLGIMLVMFYPRLFGADVYTLYRNSVTDRTATGHSAMRIHIATFDANVSGAYNQENCDAAKKLFKQQGGLTVDYWCEKGRHK
jgi:hypothetical protein